jgi:hypothetical protein
VLRIVLAKGSRFGMTGRNHLIDELARRRARRRSIIGIVENSAEDSRTRANMKATTRMSTDTSIRAGQGGRIEVPKCAPSLLTY